MIPTEHALEARANLEWVAGKWWELKNRLRKTGGDPNAPRVGGSKEPPSEIDWQVSDLMHEITTEAVLWGRILIEEADWRQEHGEMPGLLTDVAGQYGHFVCDDDEKVAYDFCDTAAEFRRKVEGVLNRQEPTRYVGPCPEAGCQGELYMREVEGGTCPECGAGWTLPAQYAFLRAEAEDVLMERDVMRAALVSMGYDVPFETIKTWTKRGKIAEEESGLYKFGDALALAKARGERKVSVR